MIQLALSSPLENLIVALGLLLPSVPSDPLSDVLRTCGNVPTLLLISHPLDLSDTAMIPAKKNYYSEFLLLPLFPDISGKLLTTYYIVNYYQHYLLSLADSFGSFFTDKISKLRITLTCNPVTLSPHLPSPPSTPPDFVTLVPAS